MSSAATDIAAVAPRDIAAPDPEQAAGALAHVLGTGDLYRLTNEQRVAHYLSLCRRRGLNPLGRPYQWIEFRESQDAAPVLTLYLKVSGAAEILRNNHVSVHYPTREIVGELFKVEAHGTCPDGREGWATKYVPLTDRYGRLSGRKLANAYMTAESGAMRRLCIAMFGGGDEGDHDRDFQASRVVYVDGTGAVLDHPTEEQRYLADHPEAARAIGEPTYESTAAVAGAEDAAAYEAGLAGAADSAPRPEEIARSRPSRPRPSFKPSPDEVKRRLRSWHAVVDGTSLDDDDARHRFVEQWTAGYVPALRTQSLAAFFEHATDRQAEDLLAHVRAIVDDEKRAIEASQVEPGEEADTDEEVF